MDFMGRKSERPAKGAKNVETPTFFRADLVEAPHADATLSGKVEKKRKIYTGVIYAALVSMIMFAVVSLGVYSTVNDLSAKQFPAQVTLDTPGKKTAIRALTVWLASSPSPLPTGYILSWDGAKTQQNERTWTDKNGKAQYQVGIELDSFTLSTSAGSLFSTEVQVAYGAATGTGVIGAPTLIPIAPSDPSAFTSETGWLGTMPGSSTQATDDAVKSWVAAFTSGDPAALRIAVGDGRQNISYIPMTGAQATGTIDVKSSAVFPVNKNVPVTEWVANPSVAIVRVDFSIAWPGQLDASHGNVTNLGVLTYDLLVEKADTSAPKIVAWGSAGTGTTLKPYQNAVSGNVTADKLGNEFTNNNGTAPATPSPSDTRSPLGGNANSSGASNG